MNFFAAPGLRFEAGSASARASFSDAVTKPGPAPADSFSSSSSSPGLFTEEDEENERRSATVEDMVGSRADFYGTVVVRDRPAGEVRAALIEMDDALRRIPPSRRRRYDEAREKCPDQVNDEKKEAFLWRTDFDAKLAAERLVHCWEFKHTIFGEEKCYIPMTLSGALRDDIGTLSAGILQLVPVKDLCGRTMVLFDPSRRDFGKHPTESVLRAVWYVYTAALEDPDVKKRGIVWLAYVKKATPRQFDIRLYPKIMDLEGRYLPILIRAFHICHPDPFFRAISPIAKHLLGQRLRPRTGVHHGSELVVLEKLIDFGIPPNRVPTDMGGGLVMDMSKWLCDRLGLEKERGAVEDTEGERRRALAEEQKMDAAELAASAALKAYQQSLEGDRSVKKKRDIQVREQSQLIGNVSNPLSLAVQVTNAKGLTGIHETSAAAVALEPRMNIPPLPPNNVPLASLLKESAGFGGAALKQELLQPLPRHAVIGANLGQNPSSIRALSSTNSSILGLSSNDAHLCQSQLVGARVGNGVQGCARAQNAQESASLVNVRPPVPGASLLNTYGSVVPTETLLKAAVLQQLLQRSNFQTTNSAGVNSVGHATMTAGAAPNTALPNNSNNLPQASFFPSVSAPPQQLTGASLATLLGNAQNTAHLQQQALQETLALSASSPETQPPALDICRILFIPQDEGKVSSHQCLARKQIEAFTATESHVRSHARGRNKPVALGQVGIRCCHCKGLPLQSSQRGSIYFPATLVHLYQAAVNMSKFHFAVSEKCCMSMPNEIRDEFQRSKLTKSTVGGGKKYWAMAGQVIGIVETPEGLRFAR